MQRLLAGVLAIAVPIGLARWTAIPDVQDLALLLSGILILLVLITSDTVRRHTGRVRLVVLPPSGRTQPAMQFRQATPGFFVGVISATELEAFLQSRTGQSGGHGGMGGSLGGGGGGGGGGAGAPGGAGGNVHLGTPPADAFPESQAEPLSLRQRVYKLEREIRRYVAGQDALDARDRKVGAYRWVRRELDPINYELQRRGYYIDALDLAKSGENTRQEVMDAASALRSIEWEEDA